MYSWMRVDPRSNYLFVVGCVGGNAGVFDEGSGASFDHSLTVNNARYYV